MRLSTAWIATTALVLLLPNTAAQGEQQKTLYEWFTSINPALAASIPSADAGLVDLLNGTTVGYGDGANSNKPPAMTLFAPTEDAYLSINSRVREYLSDPLHVNVLKDILENHVITGKNLTSTKLLTMRGQNVTFLNNKTLQLDVTNILSDVDEGIKDGGVVLHVKQQQQEDSVIQLGKGGAVVTQQDAVYASNGMGHAINRVMGIISLVDMMEEMVTSGALPVSLESILENATSAAAAAGTEINPAMVKAQLDNAALTLFAPAKAAFLIFGFANPDFASVMKDPGWYMHTASLLAKHVTQDGGVLMKEDFVTGGLEVKMFNQETVYIEADTANPDAAAAAGTFAIYPSMNDVSTSLASVDDADILAYEGVVHMIDRVLLPGFMELNVMDVIRRENPTLAALFDLVPDIVTSLEEAFGVTVFLPTTEALANTVDATMMQHLQSPEHGAEMLATLLKYHIVAYNVPTTSMENEMILKTGFHDDEEDDANSAATLTVQREGRSIVIVGSSDGATSTITKENRLARNGLVHLMDTVLLPASLPTLPQFPLGSDTTTTSQPGDNGVVTNVGGTSGAAAGDTTRSFLIVGAATLVAIAMSSIVWAL